MLEETLNTMVFKLYPGLREQKVLIFKENECINEINFPLTGSFQLIGDKLIQIAIEQKVKDIEIYCDVPGLAQPIYNASQNSNSTKYAKYNINITLTE